MYFKLDKPHFTLQVYKSLGKLLLPVLFRAVQLNCDAYISLSATEFSMSLTQHWVANDLCMKFYFVFFVRMLAVKWKVACGSRIDL